MRARLGNQGCGEAKRKDIDVFYGAFQRKLVSTLGPTHNPRLEAGKSILYFFFFTLFCSFASTNIEHTNVDIQRKSIPPFIEFYKFYKCTRGQGEVFAGFTYLVSQFAHCRNDGATFDFQLKNIILRVSGEANAKTFECKFESLSCLYLREEPLTRGAAGLEASTA